MDRLSAPTLVFFPALAGTSAFFPNVESLRLLSPGMLPDVVQLRALDRAVCVVGQALYAVLAAESTSHVLY
jgi:hypothetical protein